MGARLTRGSSLSDDKVIAYINDNFVPIELNLSKTGFPTEMPGLKAWEQAYKRDWRYRMAFATSVVLDSRGRYPLGTSGSGHRHEAATSANYHPDLYLKFLTDSKSRGRRLTAVQEDKSLTWAEKLRRMATLRSEILQQLKEANSRGGWKRAKASSG